MNNLTKLVAKNCKIVLKKSKKSSQNFFLDIARICINTFKRVWLDLCKTQTNLG